MYEGYLPISKQDMQERGIKQLDFVYVCGDAYVDHPSFGHAIIARLLEAHGYTVGIIAQPDWKDDASISVLGVPRLGFLVSAGNMDSMVNHYSVSKKRRRTDAYTPGGEMGKRPDHACVVYGNLIRQKYKKTAVIMGGIEASLRRMAHYDYWSDKLKRSILLDSGADIVFVCLGAPKQEQWIERNRDALKVRVAMGIGGSLDVFAGKVERAPEIFCKTGMEWFYRLCKEPWRIGRMMELPKFAATVIAKGKKYKQD